MKRTILAAAVLAALATLIPAHAQEEQAPEGVLRRVIERLERIEVRLQRIEEHRAPGGIEPLFDAARRGDRGAIERLLHLRREIDQALAAHGGPEGRREAGEFHRRHAEVRRRHEELERHRDEMRRHHEQLERRHEKVERHRDEMSRREEELGRQRERPERRRVPQDGRRKEGAERPRERAGPADVDRRLDEVHADLARLADRLRRLREELEREER